ncbi:hypothetical protein V8J36_04315 [Frigidibacter sp. MR17.14]|uniref:DUF883 family protein n=1 Tax=Frigidibacter sp. MR17.14 TaxID=3126509 RepID=UPI003012BFB9
MARAAAYTNGKAAEADLVALQKQIAALKDDLSNITTTLGDYGKHQSLSTLDTAKAQAETLRAQTLAKLDTLTSQAAAQLETMRAQAGTVATQADTFVKERPATAVGIAAGIGFALGLLTATRR